MSAKKKIVIGKVPGYNGNIDPKNLYAKRLTEEFTRIRLYPTGYQINFGSMGNDNGTGIYTLGGNINKEVLSSVFRSTEEGKVKNVTTKLQTYQALTAWKDLIKGQQVLSDLVSLLDQDIDMLEILCTNDSTLTETFSNNFGKSKIETLMETGVGKVLGNVSNLVTGAKQAVTGLDSGAGLKMMGAMNTKSNLLNLLLNKTFNMQTALPQEWISSDYNNQIQIMIKLVSPTGDQASINEYILKPLIYLTLATAPITTTGIFYGYPPLWRIEADGLMGMKVGGISNMTITRGGTETQFNKDKKPLNVDVRMTIVPIIPGFASPLGDHDLYNGTSENPKMIIQSFQDIKNSIIKVGK